MSWFSILWLVLAVVFVGVEISTVSFVSIWFAVGALAALLASIFVDSIIVQFAIFVAVSAISLLLFMKPLRNKMAKHHTPTNADSNIGRVALVITSATPDGHLARVHLDGVDWNARCTMLLSQGMECRVLSIQGATLIVEPIVHSAAIS